MIAQRAKWGETAAVADDLAPGLYEELITAALVSRLASTDDALVERIALRPADAADRIAQHLARELMRAIDGVPEAERVATGIEVARLLIAEISERLPRSGSAGSVPTDPASVLTAIGERRLDGSVRMPGRPLIPLLDTTLLTNAPGSHASVARYSPRSNQLTRSTWSWPSCGRAGCCRSWRRCVRTANEADTCGC